MRPKLTLLWLLLATLAAPALAQTGFQPSDWYATRSVQGVGPSYVGRWDKGLSAVRFTNWLTSSLFGDCH